MSDRRSESGMGTLALHRAEGQSIRIGDDITVTVEFARGGQAKLIITAPRSVPIVRDDAKVKTPRPRPEGGGA